MRAASCNQAFWPCVPHVLAEQGDKDEDDDQDVELLDVRERKVFSVCISAWPSVRP